MTRKPYPTDVIDQARAVWDAWNQINEGMSFGDLTNNMLSAELTQVVPLEAEMNRLEIQLTDLRNQRDALYLSMWEKVKRVRAGVKANYGDDSSQYEMVGGTRMSERKSPVRKTPVTT